VPFLRHGSKQVTQHEAKTKYANRFGSHQMDYRFSLYATTPEFKEDNFEFCCWNTENWYAFAKEQSCQTMQELFRKLGAETENSYSTWLTKKVLAPVVAAQS